MRRTLFFVIMPLWALGGCAGIVGFPDRELASDASTDGPAAEATARDATPRHDASKEDASATDASHDGTTPPPDAAARDAHADAGTDASPDVHVIHDAGLPFCKQHVPDTGLVRVFCDDFEEGDASLGGEWELVDDVALTMDGGFGGSTSLLADIPANGSMNPSVTQTFAASLDGGLPSSQSFTLSFDFNPVSAPPSSNGEIVEVTMGGPSVVLYIGYGGTSLQLQEYANGTGSTFGAPKDIQHLGQWARLELHMDVVPGANNSVAQVSLNSTVIMSYTLMSDWEPGTPTVQLGVAYSAFDQPDPTTEARALFDNVEFFEAP